MLFKNTLALAATRTRSVRRLSSGRRSIYPKISSMPTATRGKTVGAYCSEMHHLLRSVNFATDDSYSGSSKLHTGLCSYFPHCSSPKEPQLELHHNPEEVIQHTKAWVDGMIVGMRLCPVTSSADLAGVPLGSIRYEVSTATTITGMHADWFDSVGRFVDTDEEEAGSLMLLFPQFTSDNVRFHIFAAMQQKCAQEIRAIETIGFHPEFRAPSYVKDEAVTSSYSHRSPYPMLQFIRSEMTTRAKKGDLHAFAHVVPNNRRKLADVGEDKLQAMLEARDWTDMLKK